MFDFILYVTINNFPLCQDGSSWVEPVLSKDTEIMNKAVLENEYKDDVPLFSAAYAALNKGTSILYILLTCFLYLLGD